MPEITNITHPTDLCSICAITIFKKEGHLLYGNVSKKEVICCGRCVERAHVLNRCEKCSDVYVPERYQEEMLFAWPGLQNLCYNCGIQERKIPPLLVQDCACCGTRFGWREPIDTCKDCQEQYMKCPGCDSYISKEGVRGELLVPKQNDRHWMRTVSTFETCLSCAIKNPNLKKCSLCHSLGPPQAFSDKKPNVCVICAPTAAACANCGALNIVDTMRTHDGKKYCSSCEERGSSCDRCRKWSVDCGAAYHHHKDIDPRMRNLCMQCINSPILKHNFKKPPRFQGEGPLFYGFENEFDFKLEEFIAHTDTLRAWAAARKNLFHLVHDGTLKNGVELVSQPGSFDFWAAQKEQDVFPPIPNEVGFGTAGCHIHMSKAAFTTAHLHRFLVFINDNFKNLVPVFGRGLEQYCCECPIDLQYYAKRGRAAQHDYRDKYWFVNMRGGSTVEIRIFVAATMWAELLGNIQLLDSIYHYTKETPLGAISWREYYKFANRDNRYYLFMDLLEKRPAVRCVFPKTAKQLAESWKRRQQPPAIPGVQPLNAEEVVRYMMDAAREEVVNIGF